MTRPSPTPAWTAELWLRMRRFVVIKTLGITGFTWLFFLGYFHLLRHPAYPVTLMPLTALDHLIPFQPIALFPYLSLWFYVGIAPALQRSFRELVVYGLWVGALCVTGLALFHFWPTAVPPRPLDTSGLPGFALLKGVDAPGNACPSMHVAVAIFSACWIDRVLTLMQAPRLLRGVNLLWFVAIAYSTLAIKQHVALDATAGALLGVAFAWPSLRWPPARMGAGGGRSAAADIISSH